MSSARAAVFWAGLGLMSACPDGSALALESGAAVAETAQATLAGTGSPAAAAATASLRPVGPGPVDESLVQHVESGVHRHVESHVQRLVQEPAETGSFDLKLPPPPEAPVVVSASDALPAVIGARLADPAAQLHPRLPRKERDAIAAFYGLGAFKPLWIANGAWTGPAQAVIERLKAAGEDGIDASDYPVPLLGVTSRGDSAADLAEAELKLTASAVAYARDARGARIDPARLSSLLTPKLDIPAADAVLTRLAGATDAGAALAAYNPPHPGYRALKDKLAEMRANRPGAPTVSVPQGPALKVGMRDARVPLVRARFGLGLDLDETVYDGRVASAVADFQRGRGIPATGVLTRQTIAALGGPSPARVEGDIVANMERWRWLPAELGRRHILVNVPEYRVRVIEAGDVVHETRAIVGKPETPTPLFSGTMDHAIVNPSWTIPPSILKKEFLPMMEQDPFYAERKGFQVIRRGNQISIRQPPGERNALGFIKFMFPNQHAVYLHDTPSRKLFGAERRAFSHGCVRVEDPFRLAEVLLGQGWPKERLRRLIGAGERTIHLPEKLPVHLTYFTIQVNERGELRSLEDIYGTNRRVRAALGLGA